MSKLGDNIRAFREKADYTQEQLAEIVGINRVSLARYESGKIEPGSKVLGKIANALHVSTDVLYRGDDSMSGEDRELWELREQVRRDPERHYLFSIAKDAKIEDVRQAVAIIDALKKSRGGD